MATYLHSMAPSKDVYAEEIMVYCINRSGYTAAVRRLVLNSLQLSYACFLLYDLSLLFTGELCTLFSANLCQESKLLFLTLQDAFDHYTSKRDHRQWYMLFANAPWGVWVVLNFTKRAEESQSFVEYYFTVEN